MDVVPSELWSVIAQWLIQEENDSRTVLEAAVDLCSLQSVCRKTRTCASSACDKLIPRCISVEPYGPSFLAFMMCQQYSLTARPTTVSSLVYTYVLRCKQEVQTAKRKEILEACLAKNGLQLRADSRLCSAYIATGQGEPAHIATVMLEMAWLFENTNYAEMLQQVGRQTAILPPASRLLYPLCKTLLQEKRESCELLSYHNRRVEDYEEYGDGDELVEDYKQIKLLERELENASEVAKGKAVRVWQYHGKTGMPQTLMRYLP